MRRKVMGMMVQKMVDGTGKDKNLGEIRGGEPDDAAFACRGDNSRVPLEQHVGHGLRIRLGQGAALSQSTSI